MSKKAILVEWVESERGWGIRPDGYSVHVSKETAEQYIKDYWAMMPQQAPDEYSRPEHSLEWKTISISDQLYTEMVAKDDKSVRLWEHPDQLYPITPTIVYKIRRKSDGLYSTGGSWPTFSTTGKIWRQKGHLTSHLKQLAPRARAVEYHNCDIVQFEVIEEEIESTSVATYTSDLERLARERARQEAKQKDAKQRLKDEVRLNQLAKKLGKKVV